MYNGDLMDYQDFLVFGAARSGLGATRLLRAADKNVTVYDEAPREKLAHAIAEIHRLEADFLNDPADLKHLPFRALILSPGIPETHPIVFNAEQRGCIIRSEIELGFQCSPAPILAITGTNGKTTTTHLVQKLFEAAGHPSLIAGNVGTPLCDAILDPRAQQPDAIIACEVSSFQLEHIETFRPEVAAILNITPDHLDRYPDIRAYVQAKARISENQQADQHLVVNADDRLCQSVLPGCLASIWEFSLLKEPKCGAWLQDNQLMLKTAPTAKPIPVMQRHELPLPGNHNVANALAAICFGAARGLEPPLIRDALRDFQGVPHRIEYLGDIDGARYYNDSKATNLDALARALESFDQPIVLLAGGRDKGAPWSALDPLVRQRVRALVAYGEAADIALDAWSDLVPSSARADNLEEAFRLARDTAQPGNIVLLSPACSSFDQYKNFEERGEHFRSLFQKELRKK